MTRRSLSVLVFFAAFAFLRGTSLRAQDASEKNSLDQDPLQIVRRSVERDWTDYASVKNYTYHERTDLRRSGSAGNVVSSRTETNEILILDERPYEKLIARNDQPLSEAEARKEQAKLDKEASKREHESPAQIARYEKQRNEDRQFIREIPDAFHFRLMGTESISGQPCWIIDAEPKPGYRAVNSGAKILSKLRATIWIEQATYHWVKVDAQALQPLWFGFALLRVAPGGVLHFEQTRVNGEIWLPSKILVHADARVALVKKIRAEFDIRYSDYRKFQSDSRIVSVQQN